MPRIHHPVNLFRRISRVWTGKTQAYSLNGSMILFLALGLTLGWGTVTKAVVE